MDQCTQCPIGFVRNAHIEVHIEAKHEKTLNKQLVDSEAIKPSPLYKCNNCSFIAMNTDNLTEHKKEQHRKKKPLPDMSIFFHTCISCDFQTNDYNELRVHIDTNHKDTSNNETCDGEEIVNVNAQILIEEPPQTKATMNDSENTGTQLRVKKPVILV